MTDLFAVVFRLVMAVASLAGVVAQLIIVVRTDFSLANLFSFFTILSTLFASIIFIVGAARVLRGLAAA